VSFVSSTVSIPPLLALCLAFALVSVTRAQVAGGQVAGGQVAAEHSRRIVKAARPEYPVVLKTKGIGGVVRLNVRVLANGSVASVSIGGGNPILAESAVKSIMTWKFEPAPSATNQVITFDFNAH